MFFEYENRPDPFSQYRSGFEVRTTLRCKRILSKSVAETERLVRAYDFIYADEILPADERPANGVSLLSKVRVVGFADDGTETVELPPLDLSYSKFEPQLKTDLIKVGGNNLPFEPLSNSETELVDLIGNGLPDLLQMNGVVRYWRNRGKGKFDLPKLMNDAPAGLSLTDSGVQMIDADGDGRIDLMITNGPLTGYFPMNHGATWDKKSFRRYESAPSFNLQDPEVRLLDLSGDGVIDAIRSGSRLECFFNSAKGGWGESRFVERKRLEDFPNVNFSDSRVRLGDMTGDGLQDIVLVHDGNVEYWANLGRGNWSRRVRMRGNPRFPFGFDPKHILLGDIDGDGLADIVLVENRRVTIWINQSGNSWSRRFVIEGTPPVNSSDQVRLVDLNGSGVSGVLWSLEANSLTPHRMYFLDLAGKGKPYLLTGMDNNVGAETRIEYASSTEFYLEDENNARTRWQTYLPFPVQVVKRVEMLDEISRNKLTTRYKYHHGYWDGAEREFRGFGMVEQFDTETELDDDAAGLHENIDGRDPAAGNVSPPTLTKTWFYQGAVGGGDGDWREADYKRDYFQQDPPFFQTHSSLTGLPEGSRLDRQIKRDALRAMRGMVLRTELYAPDGSQFEGRPYTVAESQLAVQEIEPQPSADEKRRRIFFPHVVAARTTQWERGDDPLTRITYTDYTDESGDFDKFGRPRLKIDVALPRRSVKRKALAGGGGDPNEKRVLAVCARTEYAASSVPDIYIHDRVSHTRTFELKSPPTVNETDPNDVRQVMLAQLSAANAARQTFRQAIGQPTTQVELINHTINHYDGGDESYAFKGLDAGLLDKYGALVRMESLVFDSSMLVSIYDDRRPDYLQGSASRPASAPQNAGAKTGYRLESASTQGYQDGYYADTLRLRFDFHSASTALKRGLVTASQDALQEARENRTEITYDGFDLLPVRVVDSAGLETRAEYDYRVLQPLKITDANRNSTRVVYSPHGLPLKIYLEGRNGEGGTESDPEISYEYNFLKFQDTRAASSPQPIFVKTTRRVHHSKDGVSDETIVAYEFSDGFSRLVQTRTQAQDVVFGDQTFGGDILPPDQNLAPDPSFAGAINNARNAPNVCVSGWQRYDDKGRVIEKREPFFDVGWEYKSPTPDYLSRSQKISMKYDPRGQLIQTTNPDGSQQKVIFGIPANLSSPEIFEPTPWESYLYDENDNAGLTHGSISQTYQAHWNTPSSTVTDALGRVVAHIERKGDSPATEWFITRSKFDIRGNLLTITDALGREAFSYGYDLWNRPLRVMSIDAGLRTSVLDAVGNLIEFRDSRGCLVLREYDALNRLKSVWGRNSRDEDLTLREKLEYGDEGDEDDRAQAVQKDRLGKLAAHYDEAGVARFELYDFKGNLLEKSRQTISDTALAGGWTPAWNEDDALASLDSIVYLTKTKFDALHRPTEIVYPADVNNHQAVLQPVYSRAGTLESVRLDGATYVERIAYNAKGQRAFIAYGNGVITRHAYDARAFRLVRMRTERYAVASTPGEVAYQLQGNVLQDIAYEYDLVGNALSITDKTKGCGVFQNPQPPRVADSRLAQLLIEGDALVRKFEYDPIYRLTGATGREAKNTTRRHSFSDDARDGFNSPNHGTPDQDNAPRLSAVYAETYSYDAAGNLLRLSHTQHNSSWARGFGVGKFTPQAWQQQWQSHLNTGTAWAQTVGNQLTHVGDDRADFPQTHSFDENGNLIRENTERHFVWDYSDRMIGFEVRPQAGAQASVQARYLYGADGMRVKKWVRRNASALNDESAVYVDGVFEHQRWRENGAAKENNHLHVMDSQKRIAVVRVGDRHPDDSGPAVKYQLGDHLGSCSVVIGGAGAGGNTFINREEYFPYGETSFGSFGRKRYRFSGKERDEESGLYYFGARFYAPHLCRWISCDPLRSNTKTSPYTYAANSPLKFIDKLGLSDEPSNDRAPAFTRTPTQLTDEEAERLKIDREIVRVQSEVDSKNKRIGELNEDNAKLGEKIKNLKSKMPPEADLTKPGAQSREALAATIKRADFLKSPEGKKLMAELGKLNEAVTQNERTVADLKTQIEGHKGELADLDRRFYELTKKPPSDPPTSGGTGSQGGFIKRNWNKLKGFFSGERNAGPSEKTAAKEIGVGSKAVGLGRIALRLATVVTAATSAAGIAAGDMTVEEGAKEMARGTVPGMVVEGTIEHAPAALEAGVKAPITDSFGVIQNRASYINSQTHD